MPNPTSSTIPKKFTTQILVFILLTAFLNMMGLGIIIPVVPFLVQHYVGAANVNAVALYVGLMTSIYAFCQFLATPGLGMLSDRFGRRPILIISLLGSVIGYLLLGIGGSLWILFLGRIIDGLTGGNISTIFAYIADMSEPKDRAKYYGLIGAAMGFGFIIGPALGGVISTINLTAPFYLAAVVTLLTVVLGYFSLPESLAAEHRVEKFELSHLNPISQLVKVFNHQMLRVLLITMFFYALPFAMLQGNAAVLLKDALHWNAEDIGFLFVVIGVVDIFTQGFLINKLLPFLGEVKLAIIGLILVVIAYLFESLLPVLPLFFMAYAGAMVYGFGSGFVEPALNSLISHTAEPREQGRVQGASQSVQSIARVIGPLIAAELYQITWSTPYLVCIVLAGIAIVMVIKIGQTRSDPLAHAKFSST